jgi:N-methylhydantoinase B
MQAGDVIEVYTPGGGGYGDPARRSTLARENDIRQGYYPG